MSRLLLITTVYRTGEKIYPIISSLSRQHDMTIMNLYQMSQHSPWNEQFDPRKSFYRFCEDNNCNILHGPRYYKGERYPGKGYDKYVSRFDKLLGNNYDLVLVDNNITVKGGCMSEMYRWFAKQSIPVVACPHGNRDIKSYRVIDRIGRLYDYSFLFGNKEKKRLLAHKKKYKRYKNRLLCGGIPSNDSLPKYKRNNKYILVITNFTEKKYIGSLKMIPFTKKTFDKIKLLKLSDKYQCPIVIKIKNKIHQPSKLSKYIKSERVEFVTECTDDNRLVADAVCVISAPSTMTFKSIQMGIPTAILPKYGMAGNFNDFVGFVQCEYKHIRKTLQYQEMSGKCDKFINDTLTGGLKFDSTNIYIKRINQFLK